MGSGKYARLAVPFKFYSRVLKRWVIVPEGFVFDFESVPFLRGTCPEAGCAHDYLCRKDSNPIVSKAMAAEVYFEVLDYVYAMDDLDHPQTFPGKLESALDLVIDTTRKWLKYWAVCLAPGYFHRYKVMDSYEVVSK